MSALDRAWLALSSPRTTAALALALTALAGVAVAVPQGPAALELARVSDAAQLRTLAAWGLTDVLTSPWVKAVAALLAVNALAVLLRLRGSPRRSLVDPRPPARAVHEAVLAAALPERAVEALRETFRSALGASPVAEQVDGSRVTMVFDTSPGAARSPLLAHLGLVLLVAGVVIAVQPPPPQRAMVRALLDVQDSRTGTVGVFDLAQGEPMRFFQWRYEYVVREYSPSRGGLGPAVRIERILPDERRMTDFWVYLEAPPGFDAAHRGDVVSITARRMGLEPMPGQGMASSPGAVLVVLGLGLLVAGLLGGVRPEGRLWLEADGDQVRVVGLPARAGDHAFGRGFTRWALLARAAVEAT